MGLSTVGRGNIGGRSGGSGDRRPPPPKHYIPIYRDSSDIGAASVGVAATRRAGVQEIV